MGDGPPRHLVRQWRHLLKPWCQYPKGCTAREPLHRANGSRQQAHGRCQCHPAGFEASRIGTDHQPYDVIKIARSCQHTVHQRRQLVVPCRPPERPSIVVLRNPITGGTLPHQGRSELKITAGGSTIYADPMFGYECHSRTLSTPPYRLDMSSSHLCTVQFPEMRS